VAAEHPSLTVVVPVFNQAAEIAHTLSALDEALTRTTFTANVVVVDDGSTDGTADAARAVVIRYPLEVIVQENRGRLEARRRGLERAKGDYCLMLDSRIVLESKALEFIEQELESGGAAKEVWTGHVHIATEVGRPYAVFWDVLTSRAWSAYFGDPRTTSFGLDDFERFPKGLGCFFAPRWALVDAIASHRSQYADLRYTNDDAPVIRTIAERRRINISPEFACGYSSRTRLVPFLRHAFHRGTVFVDGHGRPESGWFPIVFALYAGSAGWLVLARRSRASRVAPFAAASVAGAALAVSEHRAKDAPTMAWVTPVYATAHVLGMWRGLGLMLRDRLRQRREIDLKGRCDPRTE
jgi:glycosyltransferase involved in cell wall biosynthesis